MIRAPRAGEAPLTTAPFRHVLSRHGLWEQARYTEPGEFGPLVNLGLLLVAGWSGQEYREFIRTATKRELALFIALLATLGSDVMEAYAITGAIERLGAAAAVSSGTPKGSSDQ